MLALYAGYIVAKKEIINDIDVINIVSWIDNFAGKLERKYIVGSNKVVLVAVSSHIFISFILLANNVPIISPIKVPIKPIEDPHKISIQYPKR